jgi:hypothetical protein
VSLLIQKSTAKLCCCRFKNQQPITASLSIQKSADKNFVTVDLEINTQIVPSSIQKSAANNCVADDSKIDS